MCPAYDGTTTFGGSTASSSSSRSSMRTPTSPSMTIRSSNGGMQCLTNSRSAGGWLLDRTRSFGEAAQVTTGAGGGRIEGGAVITVRGPPVWIVVPDRQARVKAGVPDPALDRARTRLMPRGTPNFAAYTPRRSQPHRRRPTRHFSDQEQTPGNSPEATGLPTVAHSGGMVPNQTGVDLGFCTVAGVGFEPT
jgi:hypothetical protein